MTFLVVAKKPDGEIKDRLIWKDKNEDEQLKSDQLHCDMEICRYAIGTGINNRISILIEMLRRL